MIKTLNLNSGEINLHPGIAGMHRMVIGRSMEGPLNQFPLNDDDVVSLRDALNELLPKEKQV